MARLLCLLIVDWREIVPQLNSTWVGHFLSIPIGGSVHRLECWARVLWYSYSNGEERPAPSTLWHVDSSSSVTPFFWNGRSQYRNVTSGFAVALLVQRQTNLSKVPRSLKPLGFSKWNHRDLLRYFLKCPLVFLNLYKLCSVRWFNRYVIFWADFLKGWVHALRSTWGDKESDGVPAQWRKIVIRSFGSNKWGLADLVGGPTFGDWLRRILLPRVLWLKRGFDRKLYTNTEVSGETTHGEIT
jgi:hypothetical protein